MALQQFIEIAHRIVWRNLATVDGKGRPRSGVVHPVWEQHDTGITGWVVSRWIPLRLDNLRHWAFASCAYWDPERDVAVAECAAGGCPADSHPMVRPVDRPRSGGPIVDDPKRPLPNAQSSAARPSADQHRPERIPRRNGHQSPWEAAVLNGGPSFAGSDF